jgi:Pyruvate/2-oxoacid:ferredoxin oxidoreductase gamma subunit
LLARGFTIDQSAVSDAELGKRAINMLEVAAFAEVLGIPQRDVVNAFAAEYAAAREMVA